MSNSWEAIRVRRDDLLQETDRYMLADHPRNNNQALRAYRQALRDLPSQFPTPEEVVWPDKPDII